MGVEPTHKISKVLQAVLGSGWGGRRCWGGRDKKGRMFRMRLPSQSFAICREKCESVHREKPEKGTARYSDNTRVKWQIIQVIVRSV